MNKTNPELIIQCACMSDPGRQRPGNEDYWGKFPEDNADLNYKKGQLFIVADGMGGHTRGREASETAVNIIQQEYYSYLSMNIHLSLKDAFDQANTQIYLKGGSFDQSIKMGTTGSALVLSGDMAFIAHVGDSRVYKMSSDRIEQITQDHSFIAEMKQKGILTEEEAKHHPRRSEINRALGIMPHVEVDIIDNIPLMPGDRYILCTDGLNKVSPAEIKEIVLKHNAQLAAESLIKLANERGGEDNITVQVIHINEKPQKKGASKKAKKKGSKYLPYLFYIFLLIIFVSGGFYFWEPLSGIINKIYTEASGVFDSENSDSDEIQLNKTNHETAGLIKSAVIFFNTSEYDSAIIAYQRVLQKNPLHLEAIAGIDRLVNLYKEKAESEGAAENFEKALVLTKKAMDLRPNDLELKELLKKYEQNLNHKRSPVAEKVESRKKKSETKNKSVSKNTVRKTESNLQKTNMPEWEFPGLNSKTDYRADPSKIIFLNSPWPKKALFSGNHKDFIIQVDTKLNTGDLAAQYGVIIGNNSANDQFYLFTLNGKGRYVLEHRIHEKADTLFSGKNSRLSSSHSEEIKIKIKCIGPWIIVYTNDSLLKSWQGKSFIEGQVGLYVDSHLEIEFYDFKISGILKQNN